MIDDTKVIHSLEVDIEMTSVSIALGLKSNVIESKIKSLLTKNAILPPLSVNLSKRTVLESLIWK